MKYKLLKDLPTFKAGTIAWRSKHENLVTETDGKTIVVYSASTLTKFPNILTEWFTPVEEKRKAVPDYKDKFYTIRGNGKAWQCTLDGDEDNVCQGNWRWTREEAEAEVAKRAAIERVRRYLVENNLIEEDEGVFSQKDYWTLYARGTTIKAESHPGACSYYSPYGRIKDTLITQFIEDCREDLLMIHK